MLSERNKLLLESIKRLLRRGANSHLRKIVNKTHAADLSAVFRSLSLSQQKRLFGMIEDVEQKGILFSELDEDSFLKLIEDMDIADLATILEHIPTDDAADLVGRLPQEKADEILERMNKEGSDEVEELLRYDDDTAGGIMVPDFIALKEDMTARQVIESLQKEYLDVEMPFYLYVVDDHDRLVGVSSLRQLVVVPPQTPLKEFMTTDVFSVQTNMDQEEVARIVARYDILAVPVVDENRRLVGIVTVDDVMRPRSQIEAINLAVEEEDLIHQLVTSHHARLPVYDGEPNNVVGMVQVRRALGHLREGTFDLEQFKATLREPYYIPAGTSLYNQLAQFQATRQTVGLAADEYGELQGLVTMADILEEIVGEFSALRPGEEGGVVANQDGSILVEGGASLRQLNRKWDLDFPIDGPRTLNGLLLERLESMPEPGVSVLLAGYPVEVVQVQGRMVKTARIGPKRPAA